MRRMLLAVVLLCGSAVPVRAQFGKNHVQYKNFDAYFMQSEHFDIYFMAEGQPLAEFVAETAEASYRDIKHSFQYELTDRITIIVYNSHNDFEQTNVQLAPGEESVGGFTEFFKNRIVIPFEGHWEKFRHVIHHELAHAVMLQMIYGAGMQSIITGLMQFQLPLWFVEGLAEYEARGWDTESDMFIRDAALNGYLPEISRLGGFLAYKGGQSVFYYISQKYGPEKIGELLGKIKITKNLDRGLRQAIGLNVKELSRRWHKYLKQQYWPDIAEREEPIESARQLTDHVEQHNFINNSPALSPTGEQMAFLSDRSDYFDIYLMSTVENGRLTRLVSGQTTERLEELHWLRPGIAWSPDGRFLAFAAKAGARDALHIVDVQSKKIVRTLKFELDGVFSPTWSPAAEAIAFSGIQRGQSDIYLVHLQDESLDKLTDDVFSDLEPSYSPDGKAIAFISDRGDYIAGHAEDFTISQHDYRNNDVYILRIGAQAQGKIRRLTNTPFGEKSPVFSPDGSKIAYASDRNGIYNIFLHDLHTGIEYPVTNSITGISQLSWAGTKLAFTAFYNGGYDIFMLQNPLLSRPGEIHLQNTNFLTALEQKTAARDGWLEKKYADQHRDRHVDRYRNYFFDEEFARGKIHMPEEKTVFLDTASFKTPDGEYKVRRYKPRFTPDIIYGNAGYSQFFGVQGSTIFALSDVLGNQRFELYTDLFYDIRNSDYLVRYLYLPRRIDFGLSFFHNAYFFFSDNYGWLRDRYFGSSLYASLPLSRFVRLEGSARWLGINRDVLERDTTGDRKLRVLLLSLAYVRDTAVWGWTGPVNGGRSRLQIDYSPGYNQKYGLDFFTVRGDIRKYYKFNKELNLVVRLAAGASMGRQPQQFFLGGIDNWINLRFRGDRLRVDQPELIYFSTFETPLRGTDYYEQIGTRFGLVNLEFRFPMIRHLILGWPLPLGLSNVRGALFTDIGAAWNDDAKFRPFRRRKNGARVLNDIKMGYGIGARSNLGFLLLRFDTAWSTNLYSSSSKPKYYFSLGAEF